MTSLRRLGALAATFLVTAGLGVATAPAAAAAPYCEYFADLPAKVSIDRPSVRVAVPLRGCEGTADYASADVYGPAGLNDILIWDGTRTDYWYLYDWDTPPGVYDTHDGGGWTQDLEDQAWRGDTTVVKYGSWAGISATRVGTRVTLSAYVTRYNPSGNNFVPYGGRVIAFQHCLTDVSGCSTLAYAVTNSAGRATITVNAPALRSYRVTYGDSTQFWGATSARARR
jgi:hypothetical protein